jgi:hypothetical protein
VTQVLHFLIELMTYYMDRHNESLPVTIAPANLYFGQIISACKRHITFPRSPATLRKPLHSDACISASRGQNPESVIKAAANGINTAMKNIQIASQCPRVWIRPSARVDENNTK